MSDKREYFSKFDIGDEIEFIPRFKDTELMGIDNEPLEGTVMAVKFTDMKVFYDCYSPYWGVIFEMVPSDKLRITNTTLVKPE